MLNRSPRLHRRVVAVSAVIHHAPACARRCAVQRTYLSWVLAAVFVLSGGAKLMGLEFEIEAFMRWGFPLWFMYAVGVIELLGGLALLVPRLASLAAAALGAFMGGPALTHIVHGEWGMLIVALVLMAACAFRAWMGRGELATWLNLLRIG
jgi:putative oxidoreductase